MVFPSDEFITYLLEKKNENAPYKEKRFTLWCMLHKDMKTPMEEGNGEIKKLVDHCASIQSGSDLWKNVIFPIDLYIAHLQQKKTANELYQELKKRTCDCGVLILMRLVELKLPHLALSTVRIFLLQQLLHPSKFCCIKKLFTLWSMLHKGMGTPMEEVNDEIQKMVVRYAPSTSHYYLLVDALWEQFGMSYANIYVELYIRALTIDLNYYEAAKHQKKQDDVKYLESQMSDMFNKLSTLFSDHHQHVARECVFSAFLLKPNKKTLNILKSMTRSILSDEKEMKGDSSFTISNGIMCVNKDDYDEHECKCAIKCTGFCKSIQGFDHPILVKGIPNIPYSVVKDLVRILESVRCFRFQYNVFHWQKNDDDLDDYLKEYSTDDKSYESDTECEEDNVPVADVNIPEAKSQFQSENMNGEMMSLQPAVKRKIESCDLKEILTFKVVGANIEVRNEEFVNKKIKMKDQNQNVSPVSNDILNIQAKLSQEYTINHGMEDNIENSIRATPDNKSGVSLDNSHTVFSSTHHLQKKSNTRHEQSSREINQNTYLLKPVNDLHNKPKDIQSDYLNSEKQLSVYQPRTPIHSTNSATSLNLTQPKLSTVESPQYLMVTHHHAPKATTILRTESRYQAIDTVSKTIGKIVNESMCYQDNQTVHCDPSSVIQHIMQQIKKSNSQIHSNEVEMPNKLAVSVNSDIVEQIRNVPKKVITNLPPFKVNVSDRSISSSSLVVGANLVVARKPQPQGEIQPLSSSMWPITSDIITIPGILISPSVIVSQQEAERKLSAAMLYKKNPKGITGSPIDERINKNQHRLKFSQASPTTFQNTCCSPSEPNPCQNYSLPSERNSKDHPNNMIPRLEKKEEITLSSSEDESPS